MLAKTAVILGATGLIGGHLLQLLLNDDHYAHIRVMVRKPMVVTHPKLEVMVIDFNNENAYRSALGKGDVIFCCIGTTMKNVKGDKALYKTIDYDIPVNAARWAIEYGFSQYLLVSAVGADSASSNFYLQLKGKVEDAISAIPYPSISIFRPSLLLGDRKEKRIMEHISQAIMPAISFLLMGSWQKYKPVHAAEVAKAMIAASLAHKSGTTVYTYEQIKTLAR